MLIIGSWFIISVWRGANTPIGGNRESVLQIIGSWCIISVWRGANTPIGGNRESVTSE